MNVDVMFSSSGSFTCIRLIYIVTAHVLGRASAVRNVITELYCKSETSRTNKSNGSKCSPAIIRTYFTMVYLLFSRFHLYTSSQLPLIPMSEDSEQGKDFVRAAIIIIHGFTSTLIRMNPLSFFG